MIIHCPSCDAAHDTQDYPNSFEINCVCGYSILVPDEAALKASAVGSASRPSEDTRFVSPVVPTAMEEEDEQILIKPESLADKAVDATSDSDVGEILGSMEMTPPEQLPDGMIYDPFELPENPKKEQLDEEEMGLDLDLGSSLQAEERHTLGDSSPPSPPKSPSSTSPAQRLIQRSQYASLGQLLGPSYSLDCEGLDRERLVSIANRCQKILLDRPWLDSELRRRDLNLDRMVDEPHLKNVPEILAVEIYLACYELGGSCRFMKSENQG